MSVDKFNLLVLHCKLSKARPLSVCMASTKQPESPRCSLTHHTFISKGLCFHGSCISSGRIAAVLKQIHKSQAATTGADAVSLLQCPLVGLHSTETNHCSRPATQKLPFCTSVNGAPCLPCRDHPCLLHQTCPLSPLCPLFPCHPPDDPQPPCHVDYHLHYEDALSFP